MTYSYQNIVNLFQQAASEHLAIKAFAEGPLDKLDSTYQDVEYPYMFCRPITSQGVVLDQNGISGKITRTFEIYMLDVPHLTDVENLKIFSNCEQYLNDIISWFNEGRHQQTVYITSQNMIPLVEAFNDRATGWIMTVDVSSPYVLDYCNYPKL